MVESTYDGKYSCKFSRATGDRGSHAAAGKLKWKNEVGIEKGGVRETRVLATGDRDGYSGGQEGTI